MLGLGSLAVMIPWPLIGFILTRSSFDSSDETVLLLGGATLIPLLLLALLGVPEIILEVLVVSVWVAVAIVPNVWFARRYTLRRALCALLGLQAAFSFLQAAVGVFMILGKDV